MLNPGPESITVSGSDQPSLVPNDSDPDQISPPAQ